MTNLYGYLNSLNYLAFGLNKVANLGIFTFFMLFTNNFEALLNIDYSLSSSYFMFEAFRTFPHS